MKKINIKTICIILLIFFIMISSTFIFFYCHASSETKVNISKPSVLSSILNNLSQVKISEAAEIPAGSIDKVSLLGASKIFSETNSYVLGDSLAEGLTAYNVLNDKNVVWTRGRRVDNMISDLEKIIPNNPTNLFLQYGINDVLVWQNNIDGFIKSYEKAILNIQEKLPNTNLYINLLTTTSEKSFTQKPALELIPEYNNKLIELCNKLNITYIDNLYILKEKDNPYSPDGIHPKAYYFKEWAYNMIKTTNLDANIIIN